jgi:hypothetical protein
VRLSIGSDLRTRGGILVVADEGAFAGSRLHGDFVAVGDELVHAGSCDGDSELVVLDLCGH